MRGAVLCGGASNGKVPARPNETRDDESEVVIGGVVGCSSGIVCWVRGILPAAYKLDDDRDLRRLCVCGERDFEYAE